MNDIRIGERMVINGLITYSQCCDVLEQQKELGVGHDSDAWERFGDIAAKAGYCSGSDIESMPGYIGDVMIRTGLITKSQYLSLMEFQDRMHKKGFDITLGQLAVNEGACSPDDIEAALRTVEKNTD